MMNPEYAPFLAAIIASPEDDTPRLIFADWLEEHGDAARAECIRGQIELVRQYGRETVDPALQSRINALLWEHTQHWTDELPHMEEVRWLALERGFISGAEVTTGRMTVLLREQIFGFTPIQNLVIRSSEYDSLRRVMEMPELGHLHSLALQACWLGESGWRPVLNCPHLRSLRRLELGMAMDARSEVRGGPVMTDDDARGFVLSHYLPRVHNLILNGWVTDRAHEMLRRRFPSVHFTSRTRY